MTLVNPQTSRPEDVFQDFFRSYQADQVGSKYRKRLAQVAVNNGISLVIDFDDLIAFDPALARSVTERPDDYVGYASSAATAQMRVEDPEYAEHAGRIFARFRRLPEKRALRKIGAEDMKKLALVEGIVVRTTQVRPMILKAVFRCRKCLEIVQEEQSGDLMRGPGPTCPSCKQKTAWELLEEQCKFKNTQEARVQERPEDLPPGQLPRYLDVRLEDDIVDSARPGDRVAVTSIVRAEKQYVGEKGRLRTFNLYLEANFVDVVGKETEVVEITREDEKKILEASKDPFVHRKLIMSLAPSIYGYGEIKEGILYLLFGGVSKHLPDGVSIRGDLNTLLIGDPGCLLGDERIVLGSGAIVKIQDLGREHLQSVRTQVLTGEGGGKRDWATRFHVYRQQPTIEVITESGKSIRGTPNHPLLAVEKILDKPVRKWKRLDEFKVGDRVAVVTGFPCTITGFVDTNWAPLPHKRGPHFTGSLPNKLTPDLAELLGYILGDGYSSRYRIGFTVAEGEKDILSHLCEAAERLFGIKPHVHSGTRKGRSVTLYEVVIQSRDVAQNLRFLREKRVPGMVLQSGNNVVSRFLRWLYEADGTVFSSKRGCGLIGLKAKDNELLRDVQILLLRFGIHSRIVSNALVIKRGESIVKFASKIGFASDKKRSRMSTLADRARRLKRLNRQRSERIVSVTEREPADVYDIEVPKTHRFIANGIVSHNTAKSQLLQYVSRIAPRGLYTSGRGTTAAGLCVDKDSMVVTRQGIRAIGDVIEEQLKDNDARSETGETIALEPSPSEIIAPIVEDRVLNEPRGGSLLLRNVSLTSLGFSKVTQYYRLRSPVLIRILTVLGKEILLTPETQVGCYDQEGRLAYWKRAEDVREEDRLLISRHLQDPGRLLRIRMLEFADEDDFVRLEAHAFPRLRRVLQREYSTFREAARTIGILEDKLYHRWRRKGLRLRDLKKITRVLGVDTFSELEPYVREIAYKSYRGIETVQVPRNLTQLMELVGCLYADGCITEDKRGGGRGLCVKFTSGDYAECERYCGLLRSLFGLTPTIKKEKDEHCYDVRFTNKIVGRLLRSLGLPVGLKTDSMQMDPAISSAPNDLLAAFLRGLISHDGWVSNRKNIGFSTSSKRLAIQVDLCLQRFGIVTALRKRRPKVTAIQGKLVRSKGNYELSIYDGESLRTFKEQIGFPQSTKSQKLVALIALKKFSHSNFIRIGHDMISVRVKRISREAANGEVYDLTVEGSHSFLANGFIVHNTAAVLREKTGGMVLEAGALVLADKGIACLHPDNEVFVDGAQRRVAELFDEEHVERVRSGANELELSWLARPVANLDLDKLRTRNATATLVARRWYSGEVLRICMDSGMELCLTPTHPVLDGKTLEWKPISDFGPGDKVVALNKLPASHAPVLILDVLPDDWIVQPTGKEKMEIRQVLGTKHHSLRAINDFYGLKRDALNGRGGLTVGQFRAILKDTGLYYDWAQRPFAYGRNKRTENLKVAAFTPELGYILGFAYGDGYVQTNTKHSSLTITQSSVDADYIRRLHEAMGHVSHRPWRVYLRKAVTTDFAKCVERQDLVGHSSVLVFLFEWLTRNGLQNLLHLDDGALAGFFAGAVDADGCFSVRKSGSYSNVSFDLLLSNNIVSNRRLIWALRRFDVYARIRKLRGVMSVQITSRSDIRRLIERISPYSGKAKDIPRTRIRSSAPHEKVPETPLRAALSGLRPVPSELLLSGDWSTFHSYRSGKRQPFKAPLQRLIRALDPWLDTSSRERLLALAGADYALEAIRTVKSEFYTGYVYDLRVPQGEHFVTEGILTHNCIDELDKMRPDDRVAIHEALEQQTVSVAKGGIVATLNARASVLAAANPALGRYEPHRNINENINLPVTILSRFDLIFLVKDMPEPENDTRMSEHILSLHKTSHTPEEAPFPPDFLRKYISYAKRIVPVLTPEAVKELQDFYLKMRNTTGKEAAVAITPRQLEGLVRISEARARAFLRDEVTVEDAKSAVKIMSYALYDVGVDVKTGKIDIDTIMTGKPATVRDSLGRVMAIVAELERETGTVDEKILLAALVEREKVTDGEARRFVGQLIKEGMLYSPKEGKLKRTSG